ncbi:MAG: nicotinamide-nucleotide adenylyltransferase [Thermoplasmataceae archaeon]
MRAFVVGRFQPFHNGHLHVIKEILSDYSSVIIGIGSAQYSHTMENPFTAGERHLMISNSLESAGIFNFYIIPIEDVNSNPLWVAHVESLTPNFQSIYSNNPLVRRLFKEKGYDVQAVKLTNRDEWSGTKIRKKILDGEPWEDQVPPAVSNIILEVDGVNRIRELAEVDD